MKEIILKGKISRVDALKNTPRVLLQPKVLLGYLLYILLIVLCVSYLLPRFGWHHAISLFVVLLLLVILQMSWNSLMGNSQHRVFASLLEYRLSEAGILQKMSWNGVEKNSMIDWSGIQAISNVGPFITFKLKEASDFSIFPSLFESEAQKEEVLTFLRQQSNEFGIVTHGF
ncbi:hypothetical protein [Granulicatella seriolae]|uniref:YcxB family protein n=1 Tax=Granulicatella seriolae TaxID=2967226 RepID=A0ABT1WQX1_9LACT|nr:hypothetical protein [Granulicatella seriolae]